MPRILKDRIIYDESDWLGGLVPQFQNTTSATGLTIGKGAVIMRQTNPFRRLGGITTGYAPAAVTGADSSSVASLIIAGDTDFGGTTPLAYLAGGTLLNKLNLSTDTILTSDFPKSLPAVGGHAAHASFDLKDLVVYNVGSSTIAFYSYSDATDGDVGAYDIGLAGSATFSDAFKSDFMSTAPSGAAVLGTDTHPMLLYDDGFLYIGDGRTLRQFDGTTGVNGTLTTVYNLPRGYVIRALTKSRGYLVVLASRSNLVSTTYYRGNSTAFFFATASLVANTSAFSFSIDLSDNVVLTGFNWNGVVGCFTYGRSARGGQISTKLKLLEGLRFTHVENYNDNPPGLGGVEIHDDMVHWNYGTATQSFLASYGSPWPGKINTSFNYLAEPSGLGQTVTSGGLCKNFGGTKLYVSSGTGTSGGLETISSNFGPSTISGAIWRGVFAVPHFPPGFAGKIESVKVYFRNSATAGRTVTLTLYTDFNIAGSSNSAVVFSAVGSVTPSNVVREFSFDSSNNLFPYFTSLQPDLTWSAGTDNTDSPTINRIEIIFKTVAFLQ